MKIENNIGWCDETTNAVTGCDKVSPGCKNCYAESGTRARVLRSQGHETWGAKGERFPVNFGPVFRRLNKLCVCDKCHTCDVWQNFGCGCAVGCGGKNRRIRLFADSNSDWLDPKWPVETLAGFLDAIRLAPNVDVLLLTKRIENFDQRLAFEAQGCHEDAFYSSNAESGALGIWIDDWIRRDKPPVNVWLGASVEDQNRADERIPLLLKTPAAVRFLSVEPLLGPIEFSDMSGRLDAVGQLGRKSLGGIDWVIVGGESGKNRRDCGARAIESVVEQCVNAAVPVYCKQDSDFKSGQRGRLQDWCWMRKDFPR